MLVSIVKALYVHFILAGEVVVKRYNLIARRNQARAKMTADKSGSAGNDNNLFFVH